MFYSLNGSQNQTRQVNIFLVEGVEKNNLSAVRRPFFRSEKQRDAWSQVKDIGILIAFFLSIPTGNELD